MLLRETERVSGGGGGGGDGPRNLLLSALSLSLSLSSSHTDTDTRSNKHTPDSFRELRIGHQERRNSLLVKEAR